MKTTKLILSVIGVVGILWASSVTAADLNRADVDNIVRRSYQYVALYDTLLNFTFSKKNPFASGGWNKTHYPEGLMDASVRAIEFTLSHRLSAFTTV